MSFTKLVLKSIWHYRKLNLTVVFGVALSTAILLGALIIGDSVKFSLQQITYQRLGRTSQVITAGERLFRKQLAEDISLKTGIRTSSLLRSNGIGVVDGGKFRLNQLAVWGVDSTLGYFSGHPESFILTGNEAAINENLAKLAGLKIGDEFLLRANKLNTFPANTPFVAASETSTAFLIKIVRVLKTEELGNFSLQNIQSAPRNVFLNLNWLNEQMKLQQKANVILVGEGMKESDLNLSLQQCWNLEDLNLKIRENQSLNYTELLSDRVFIESSIEKYCLSGLSGSYPVFSYFINDFAFGGKNTPYSFVSTDESLSDRQIIVSQWLADDLKLKVMDSLRLSYFEVGPLRRLIQKDTSLIVKSIYQTEGNRADPDLMPVIPGLSDAGNCRDWKTGVPVDLSKIRPQDESYWKQYKGTPKAFISLQTAKKLWGNRFGQSTAIRVNGTQGAAMTRNVLSGILPAQADFTVVNAKSEGLTAASNGVDFGQLFIGLSFFVLLAAFLLAWLLFMLFLGFRRNESRTLAALGFSFKKIRKLLLAEASLLVFTGILAGIPFGIIYNYLILKAINTIWYDIVRTSIAQIHLQPVSILVGVLVIAAFSMLAFFIMLHRFLKKEITTVQKKTPNKEARKGIRSLVAGVLLVLLSLIGLLLNGFSGGGINPELFYMGGFCLLPGLILLLDWVLRRMAVVEPNHAFTFRSLMLKRLSGERKRTLLAVSFLSIGIFLVVTTGLYRKDVTFHAELPSSGTGGYNYFIETTLPLLFDANSEQGKNELGLPADAQTVSFHVQPGDDASCLNLNRISRPRIIACNPAQFNKVGAFSFATHTADLDALHPWNSLSRKLSDNVIPAFADQTVIQWGLGKSVGDTLIYRDESGALLQLKLIGGLENSVFQGNVIISEDFFVEAFPSVSGANMFLVKSAKIPIQATDIQEGWRQFGAEITLTTDRLISFNRIETTYLNIFLMLGALGLLIGTMGLGILFFRITFEQIPEYALLQSVGFLKSKIYRMLLTEKLIIICLAVIIGTIPAAWSALPFLISTQHSGLWIWLPAVSFLVLISGSISGVLAIRYALKDNLIHSLSGD